MLLITLLYALHYVISLLDSRYGAHFYDLTGGHACTYMHVCTPLYIFPYLEPFEKAANDVKIDSVDIYE